METKPRIIALYSSAPQSGKTTIAKHIAKRYGYKHVSIAAPLKELVLALLKDVEVEKAEQTLRLVPTGSVAKKVVKTKQAYLAFLKDRKEEALSAFDGKSARVLMQSLGVDWGRNIMGEDFWLNLFFKKYGLVDPKKSPPTPLIIDDLRFPNEHGALKRRGAVFWKIVRKDAIRPNDHQSEGLLDDYKFNEIIKNDEGTEVLCARASERLSQYA